MAGLLIHDARAAQKHDEKRRADHRCENRHGDFEFARAAGDGVRGKDKERAAQEKIKRIEAEKDIFRQKLLILYTLSRISELPGKEAPEEVPAWLSDCLRYLSENYREKLTAQMLADRFSVGRTTLMTAFKRYTGMTVRDYLTRCRLRNSVRYLRQGMSEAEAAELCGFGDACGLIRAYRRYFRTTPRRYLAGDAALSRHPE